MKTIYRSLHKTLIIISIIVLFALLIINLPSIIDDMKMKPLEKASQRYASILNELPFENGYKLSASGSVDGDFLTAGTAESSSFASASLTVASPYQEIEANIDSSLKKVGFSISGDRISRFYSMNDTQTGISSYEKSAITFYYIKGNDIVRVTYVFSQKWLCPEAKYCGYTGKKTDDKTYDVASLAGQNVEKVKFYAAYNNGALESFLDLGI